MVSRMNTVENAARMAMGDYRLGEPPAARRAPQTSRPVAFIVLPLAVAALLGAALLFG